MITITKGIDLPISGAVANGAIPQKIDFPTATVGIFGDDFIGLKPTMLVSEGDRVNLGQALFEDKKNPGVFVCAPVSGTVEKILRGDRRHFIAISIKPNQEAAPTFNAYGEGEKISALGREQIIEILARHGLWPLLRQRPFDKVPPLNGQAHSIFVNTMDSNPLAYDPLILLEDEDNKRNYSAGLTVLENLTQGTIHIAKKAGAKLPINNSSRCREHEFGGIHPAGLVGTHIHFIDGVGSQKTVWHLNLQGLLAIGRFFHTGILDFSKVVALVGEGLKEAKLLRVNGGVDVEAVVSGNLQEGEQRRISGSVFSGRQLRANAPYLGFYDQQISVIPEGRHSIFLEYLRPGCGVFSKTRAYAGRFLKKVSPFKFTTSMQGSPRPIVPFGIYEEVMPLDILPTLLLKALVMKDTDTAVNLGALELVEEDVALLSYVDAGKHDFGAILRENLTIIEQEG